MSTLRQSKPKKQVKSDLQKFISKFDPSKFKRLKNGIEIRGAADLDGTANKARELIISSNYKLVVVQDANLASYGAFEVREAS